MCQKSLALLGAIALVIAAATSSIGLEWTGRIVDARTGDTIAEVKASGGYPGRSNITHGQRITGADGAFRLVYPEKYDEDPDRVEYYKFSARAPMEVEEDEWATDRSWVGDRLYLDYEEQRQRPAAIGDVRLVPRFAFIKGSVVDADTGVPLRGVTVRLGVPGRWRQKTVTDANGQYRLRMDAYYGSMGPSVETTPQAARPEGNRHSVPFEAYAITANYGQEGPGENYEVVQTAHPDEADPDNVAVVIPLLSSVDPEVHTRVDFRLPKVSSGAEISARNVQVTPPGGTGAEPSDLEATLARLNALIDDQEKALEKAATYGALQCSKQLVLEMKQVREELERLR